MGFQKGLIMTLLPARVRNLLSPPEQQAIRPKKSPWNHFSTSPLFHQVLLEQNSEILLEMMPLRASSSRREPLTPCLRLSR